MNKDAILKISGLVLIPFFILLIAAFFLYPYLNEDKYEEIVKENQSEFGMPLEDADSLDSLTADSLLVLSDSLAADSLSMIPDSVLIASEELTALNQEKDSLQVVLDSLTTRLDSVSAGYMELWQEKQARIEEEKRNEEDFATRVKSLLNLEDNDLGPILEKMSNEQLVRLYKGGGTLQREKILRSLNSDRAARLMTEIML